jgi:hypothetical protein
MPSEASALERAVKKMTVPELRALYTRMTDGSLDHLLPPRERLRELHRREEIKRFMAWFETLPLTVKMDVYMRTVAGEKIEPPQTKQDSKEHRQ